MPLSRVVLWVVTLTALGFLAKSWLVEPVTGVWLLGAFLVLLSLVAAGFLFPRWEMFADLLWRGPDDARGIVLTFDGVPSNAVRGALLDVLRESGIRATFFVPGDERADEAALKQLVTAGHDIGLRLASGGVRLQDAQHRLRSSLDTHEAALLPVARPDRWLGPRLANAARKSGLTLVGASTGWPEVADATTAWQLRPGDLIALDANASAEAALTSLIEAATDSELRWTTLESWLPGSSKSGASKTKNSTTEATEE